MFYYRLVFWIYAFALKLFMSHFHYQEVGLVIIAPDKMANVNGGSVGCAVRLETGGRGFNSRRGRQHSFVEIDHEIFSTVILSLLLIQEGQLSVSGERMCTILVNHLVDY